jgi:hypothetical protein
MQLITSVDDQIRRTLADLGAFDETCPGCGHGHAFRSAPRLRGHLAPLPGHRQEVIVLLPCPQCSYVAEHTVEVTWPAPEHAWAA